MTIVFQCGNIREFDQESGQYRHCVHQFNVARSEIGSFIKCPQCNQSVEVPFASDESVDSQSSITAGTNSSDTRVESNLDAFADLEGSSAIVADNTVQGGTLVPESQDSESRTFSNDDPFAHDAFVDEGVSLNHLPVSTAAVNEGQAKPLQYSGFSPRSNCRKCGGVLDNERRCTSCNHQNVLLSEKEIPLKEIKIRPSGFQGAFLDRLSSGTDGKVFVRAVHLLFGVVCVMMLIIGGLSSANAGGMLILAIVAVAIICYVYFVLEMRRIYTKPPARLNWWQKASWFVALIVQQAVGWQGRVIDLRNKKLDDNEFGLISGLKECEVLDLRGTQITDSSLRKMYGLYKLNRLVVSNTHVTDEGVFRLQQRLPRVWIWH